MNRTYHVVKNERNFIKWVLADEASNFADLVQFENYEARNHMFQINAQYRRYPEECCSRHNILGMGRLLLLTRLVKILKRRLAASYGSDSLVHEYFVISDLNSCHKLKTADQKS